MERSSRRLAGRLDLTAGDNCHHAALVGSRRIGIHYRSLRTAECYVAACDNVKVALVRRQGSIGYARRLLLGLHRRSRIERDVLAAHARADDDITAFRIKEDVLSRHLDRIGVGHRQGTRLRLDAHVASRIDLCQRDVVLVVHDDVTICIQINGSEVVIWIV